MAETDPPAPEIEAPEAEGKSRRISAVWLVPLLALLLALGVAWNTYARRGPTIEIVFDNAAGVTVGQTTVRFRDVAVGVVERLRLSSDLRQVVVTARMEKDVGRYIDADAQFWIVRPSVSAQGVTGIETVLSGVYIGAYWDDDPGPRVDRFQGLAREPLTSADQPGTRIRLRAPSGGSLTIGAPVLFKSIQVGRIENVELTDAGDVVIDAFVNAPHHLRLTEGTRFWNASGFSIEIGAGGAQLNVDSLISLLQGGVSFDTVGSDATPVEAGHVYDLYPSETAARQNFFDDAPGERVLVDARFEGSVGGLQPGAAVRFRGLQVGEVEALHAAIVDEAGQPQVTLRATLSIAPSRLGIPEDAADPVAAALDVLEAQVAQGLRARLATSGLIAQSLQVELVELPEAPAASLDRDAEPNPVIPSVPADLGSVTTSIEGVIKRVSDLPLEEVVQNAATLLGNLNALVTDERVRSAPENLGALLADLRTMLDSSGIKEAPADLSALLASARGLIDRAVEAQLVEDFAAVLDEAKTAVGSINTAAEGVPALVTEIESLSTRIRALPLDQLVADGSRLVGSIDSFVTGPQVAAIPASVNDSLAELRRLLEAMRTGGAVDNLNATLAATRRISDELAAAHLAQSLDTVIQEVRMAAGNVSAATTELPKLVDNLTALSTRVEALPLDELVTSATQVVQTADRLLASEGMAEVPPNLAAALDELRGLLAELNQGGAVNNLNATLASADRAAGAVENAANELPALVANLNRLAAEADRTLASVSPGSDINRDTLRLLQEMRDAVRSINSLVLALERRPNSVLFGR
jgi:paraquat-inducible protein B